VARAGAPPGPLATTAGPSGTVVAIGASTGGVEAIRIGVAGLPAHVQYVHDLGDAVHLVLVATGQG